MYSCVFWCEFIDFSPFFGLLLFDPFYTKKHRNKSKVSLLYLFYRKISKNDYF